mgnify:CR=1 FL=1
MRIAWKPWLMVGLLLATAAYCVAEEFTLTTYYPSPRGVYADLRVGGGGPFPAPQGMLQVIKPTATDGDGKVAFRVDDQDDDLTPFVIDETGNVGIGTASPGQPLHVIGDARIEGALKAQSFGSFSPLLFKTLDVERMRIDDTGNVGIGTAAPTALLHLSAVSGDRRIQLQSGSSSTSLITDALGGAVSTEGTGPLTLRASPTADHLVITTAGNVGIGTATPNANVKMDVNGALKLGDAVSGAAGALRWRNGVQYHDGTDWYELGLPAGVQIGYASGNNPPCPAGTGVPLMRNWSPFTCTTPGVCGMLPTGACTTAGGLSMNAPTCTYTPIFTGDVDANNQPICDAATCSSASWTEVICMGT